MCQLTCERTESNKRFEPQSAAPSWHDGSQPLIIKRKQSNYKKTHGLIQTSCFGLDLHTPHCDVAVHSEWKVCAFRECRNTKFPHPLTTISSSSLVHAVETGVWRSTRSMLIRVSFCQVIQLECNPSPTFCITFHKTSSVWPWSDCPNVSFPNLHNCHFYKMRSCWCRRWSRDVATVALVFRCGRSCMISCCSCSADIQQSLNPSHVICLDTISCHSKLWMNRGHFSNKRMHLFSASTSAVVGSAIDLARSLLVNFNSIRSADKHASCMTLERYDVESYGERLQVHTLFLVRSPGVLLLSCLFRFWSPVQSVFDQLLLQNVLAHFQTLVQTNVSNGSEIVLQPRQGVVVAVQCCHVFFKCIFPQVLLKNSAIWVLVVSVEIIIVSEYTDDFDKMFV